ncbi:hypothetical protein [Halarcobacter ebronensis]|uniref:Leucyl/phenylalanyl-tRNA--protein transferase n=1 Tax=Halarcobacter ebronensis TaxID=1462615 RepID=A0A4Q1ARG2_9BACT|nr:hypothetical protein [Halarcobacter ebronensis]QKF82237.1 leucyl, phenylalanyl-tRNA-protein transferase [Halarcobacter ebronensis]RXK07729.1 hypothetical protein CRV07_04515 [Halarcobacter ebronensis]
MNENYYWSDDFSNEFYIKAAQCGFITTSMYTKDNLFILLPEIQYEYAILNFEDIKIDKKVKKILEKKEYKFTINESFDEVLNKIQVYHKNSWINDNYIKIINNIKNTKLNSNFKFITIEVSDLVTNKLISGEIGYKIGKTYTSLSGFTTREKKYNCWGKLQLVLLNDFLKNNDYKLWNLGHPQLQYKIDLGAKIYNRKDFIDRWKSSIK